MGLEMRVLISAPYIIPEIERFRDHSDLGGIELTVASVAERLSEDELLAFAGEVDGVICGDDAFTDGVLKAFSPRLKVISKWGTGVDSIDLSAAEALGIKVFNTPDAFTDAVADSVMGYVLSFAK